MGLRFADGPAGPCEDTEYNRMLRRSQTIALALLLSSTVAFADPVRVTPKGLIYPVPEEGRAGIEFERSRSLEPQAAAEASVALPSAPAAIDHVVSSGNSVSAPPLTAPDVPGLGLGLEIAPPFNGTLPEAAVILPALPDLASVPLFVPEQVGQGLATIGFFNPAPFVPSEGFDDFSGATPNPEPGSLLLFGTGAAWIGSRWRKRRQAAAA
jgi:hypothetical protein